MGLLDEGTRFLADVFRDDHDITVTYSRVPHGKSNELTLQATPAQQISEQDDSAYTSTGNLARDFLIRVSELTFSSTTSTQPQYHEPKAGDRIIEIQYAEDDVTPFKERVYEVAEVPGDGPYRYHDHKYETYRVHTNMIEETAL